MGLRVYTVHFMKYRLTQHNYIRIIIYELWQFTQKGAAMLKTIGVVIVITEPVNKNETTLQFS